MIMTIDLHSEEVYLPGRTMVAFIVLFVLAVGDLPASMLSPGDPATDGQETWPGCLIDNLITRPTGREM